MSRSVHLLGDLGEKELQAAEGALTFVRALELFEEVMPVTGTLEGASLVHRQLFKDVFPWAGETRRTDVTWSAEAQHGPMYFIPAAVMNEAAQVAVDAYQRDGMLKGLDRGTYIAKLTYHYDVLNVLHPFHAGNGRVLRVFWSFLSDNAGWTLSWRGITGAMNDYASRVAAGDRDFVPLLRLVDRIVQHKKADGSAAWLSQGTEQAS
jgi:cell filamentation protein